MTTAVEQAKTGVVPTTLMDLTRAWQWLEWKLTETGGEMDAELDTFYTEVATSLTRKVDAYEHLLRRMEAQADFYKAEGKRFAGAAKAFENHGARLKDTMKAVMVRQGMTELQGERVRFVLSDSKASLEIDEADLPDMYWVQSIVKAPDKDAIRAILESGGTVKGARLIKGKRLTPYVGGAK